MDKNGTRKSFWKRNGTKVPGSQESLAHVTDEESDKSPVVIGARYSYTSLVSNQHKASNSLSPSPRLPSQYAPSNGKPLFSISSGNNSNSSFGSVGNSPGPRTDRAAISSPLNKKRSSHKGHMSSSTPHKSFNAFLEDTNDEWDDSVTSWSSSSIQPHGKSGIHTKKTVKISATKAPTVAPASEPHRKPTATKAEPKNEAASQQTITSTQQQCRRSTNDMVTVENVKEILKDPTFTLNQVDPGQASDPIRTKKMKGILGSVNVDLGALRSVCWSGIPPDFRLMAWQLLLGYLPCNSERRVETLARKRKEYLDSLKATYTRGKSGLDQSLWHQIHIDILRTNPTVFLYQSSITQECLERILYQWAIRHPATGYVQGINDLVTPIFEVFLSAYIVGGEPETYDMSKLDQDILDVIEADSFWCLSKLLDGIQDNYTFAQPGIQRQIATLKDLVFRIDARLANHLQQQGIEFIQFAFRWMNCLLMRELTLQNTIRMWDTYLAEGSSEGFSEFHVYVCAAFLVKWSAQLQKMDFQEVMIFLQQLPTEDWQEKDVELLLSEAYMWKTLFHNAPSHLKNK
ncbi:hypothetical protein [Absidia glauca]|uniref:Rab-GAP TBC domain-containing protein n=1 Tax=Absidia glauca TaxID=4829 RepID=A0A163JTR5_ABSGL|nr:hypothetical protein [Absidia glauca]